MLTVVEGEVPVTLANEAGVRRAFGAAGLNSSRIMGEGKGYAFGSRKGPKKGCERSRGAQNRKKTLRRGIEFIDENGGGHCVWLSNVLQAQSDRRGD